MTTPTHAPTRTASAPVPAGETARATTAGPAPRSGRLAVPGAELYYEVRGSGPVLLIAQSGEGDAGRSVDLVDRLVERYTVITYDRRGLSRSVLADPRAALGPAVHAEDAHHLLAALTDGPVAVLGLSIGAVIGLHLALRHPEQVHTLIAHEPVAPALLPAAARDHHRGELLELRELYEREGLAAACRETAKVLGIDPGSTDREAGLTEHPVDARRVANFHLFFTRELAGIAADPLTAEQVRGLRGGPVRIVPVAGRTTPSEVFDYRCAEELAALLGTAPAEFPGGHNGNLAHPAAYAARLREVLDRI
ncbi:alpha/beta hydrolase [Streptomyces sp. NPDC089919]|uniref:alpha/beta fold hydrolase n=1 Tax=Streptomyces sp. NPDC089919 TaxID=3155188 RepID=UPI003440A5FD